jgi:hypothetical protein
MKTARYFAFFVLALLLPTSATATPILRLRIQDLDTGFGIVMSDQSSADLNPVLGQLSPVTVALGVFTIPTNTEATAIFGSASPGILSNALSLNLLNLHSSLPPAGIIANGAGNLRITVVGTDFTAGLNPFEPFPFFSSFATQTLRAPAGSTITYKTVLSLSNTPTDFGPDTTGGLLSGIVLPSDAIFGFGPNGFVSDKPDTTSIFSRLQINQPNLVPYSFLLDETLHFTGSGTANTTLVAQVALNVPEPATWVLLASGLVGIGIAKRYVRA